MKRILSIQDLSCLGKCSLTVALPVLSAMGCACTTLPTAVLSTHTAFPDPHVRSLTEDLLPVARHWKGVGAEFDAITVGYLAELLNMSHNSLITKIRESFGQKPIELITAIRMQAAQEMLQKSSYSVSEIAYRLGYNDPKYFARVYKKVIGKTPSETRIKTE